MATPDVLDDAPVRRINEVSQSRIGRAIRRSVDTIARVGRRCESRTSGGNDLPEKSCKTAVPQASCRRYLVDVQRPHAASWWRVRPIGGHRPWPHRVSARVLPPVCDRHRPGGVDQRLLCEMCGRGPDVRKDWVRLQTTEVSSVGLGDVA